MEEKSNKDKNRLEIMSDEKAIRVQVWNGDMKQYNPWSEKVLADAECKGYIKMLLWKKHKKCFDVVPIET